MLLELPRRQTIQRITGLCQSEQQGAKCLDATDAVAATDKVQWQNRSPMAEVAAKNTFTFCKWINTS